MSRFKKLNRLESAEFDRYYNSWAHRWPALLQGWPLPDHEESPWAAARCKRAATYL